ncbi:MAG TPA: type II toxin-antitoxin system VapB family antitoxin [Candidatus Krumholzibacteria bacterium]|nr:type II toxin-antitoxin system VapB family antitoxin [Candidatus Krumholzibacteria bacterium]
MNVDNELLERAAKLTRITTKTDLVRLALLVVVSSESARRLARLGGTEPQLRQARRRHMTSKKVADRKNPMDAFSADDREYWLSRTPRERIEAVEILRRMKWGDAVDKPIARVVKRKNRKDPED